MLTLNSIWDILGQLINECFINPKIPQDKIFFHDIFKNQHWNSIPKEIQQDLKSIKVDNCYYITKTFANISKHRHAIQGEIHINISVNLPEVSYVTTKFIDSRGKWQDLSIDDALKCLDRVGNSIDQVGAKIHALIQK